MIGLLLVLLGFVLYKIKFTKLHTKIISKEKAEEEEIEDCYAFDYYDSIK